MSSLGRLSTGFLIPRASLLLQPLKDVQSSQQSILATQVELLDEDVFLLLIVVDFFEKDGPFLAHKRADGNACTIQMAENNFPNFNRQGIHFLLLSFVRPLFQTERRKNEQF